jgi:hypothetical protein
MNDVKENGSCEVETKNVGGRRLDSERKDEVR